MVLNRMYRFINQGKKIKYLGGTKGAKDHITKKILRFVLVPRAIYTIDFELEYDGIPGAWHYKLKHISGYLPPECFSKPYSNIEEQYNLI